MGKYEAATGSTKKFSFRTANDRVYEDLPQSSREAGLKDDTEPMVGFL